MTREVILTALAAVSLSLASCGRQPPPTQSKQPPAPAASVSDSGAAAEKASYPREYSSWAEVGFPRDKALRACATALRGVLDDRRVAGLQAERRFLTVFGKESPSELFKPFEKESVPFASRFVYDPAFKGGKFDGHKYVPDEKRAVFFDIFKIVETGTDQFTIECSVHLRPLASWRFVCVVEKNDGVWQLFSLKPIALL